MTHQQKFVLGQEVVQSTVDGRTVRNIFTLENDILVERQIEPNREVKLIREFTDKEMLGKSITGQVISLHWSKLVEK